MVYVFRKILKRLGIDAGYLEIGFYALYFLWLVITRIYDLPHRMGLIGKNGFFNEPRFVKLFCFGWL